MDNVSILLLYDHFKKYFHFISVCHVFIIPTVISHYLNIKNKNMIGMSV